ncbi:MAG: type II toxin-antitoxin system Phd/YefM family antitoxin [Oscillospiraceae bacterium]|jgi:prevent-host-death family protein|nr:type II toxin-antitoxin system Phd/YefM family antitoxin [Oscillospiraceae bacterium]
MPQIRPITDLRNTTEISNLCHAEKEPIFITKNGYGDMVVMSMEAYDELLSIVETDTAILEAEQELALGGRLENARSALAGLRRKHFG